MFEPKRLALLLLFGGYALCGQGGGFAGHLQGTQGSHAKHNGAISILEAAILDGDFPAAGRVLSSHVNVNERDQLGFTPLLVASNMTGRFLFVEALLKAGGDPGAKDQAGSNALMLASLRGQLDDILLLLRSGARIEDTDNQGNTALAIAAYGGRSDAVLLLLEHGANPKAKNRKGRTPREEAEVFLSHARSLSPSIRKSISRSIALIKAEEALPRRAGLEK